MCARVRAPSPCVRAAVWGVSWEAVKRRVTGWDPAVKSGGDVCARARAGVCMCVCVRDTEKEEEAEAEGV